MLTEDIILEISENMKKLPENNNNYDSLSLKFNYISAVSTNYFKLKKLIEENPGLIPDAEIELNENNFAHANSVYNDFKTEYDSSVTPDTSEPPQKKSRPAPELVIEDESTTDKNPVTVEESTPTPAPVVEEPAPVEESTPTPTPIVEEPAPFDYDTAIEGEVLPDNLFGYDTSGSYLDSSYDSGYQKGGMNFPDTSNHEKLQMYIKEHNSLEKKIDLIQEYVNNYLNKIIDSDNAEEVLTAEFVVEFLAITKIIVIEYLNILKNIFDYKNKLNEKNIDYNSKYLFRPNYLYHILSSNIKDLLFFLLNKSHYITIPLNNEKSFKSQIRTIIVEEMSDFISSGKSTNEDFEIHGPYHQVTTILKGVTIQS